MEAWWEGVQKGFYQTFILKNNYIYFVKGIRITLLVTVLALVLGLILGVLVAVVRSAHDQQPENRRGILLRILNGICKLYLTVVRGTPMMVQLLIMWFVIWPILFPGSARATDGNLIRCAVLAFGINSGAYVAEIVRAGILAVDKGQMEAGRSLGLSRTQTMVSIIIPQAVKNVLPPIGNEFIVLLKETAIVGYVSLTDLTRVANQIASRTYEPFMPLIGAAVIYFVVIKILTILLERFERRLRKSDNR